MKICFDVQIGQPLGMDTFGADTYQGYVTFDKTVIFTTDVHDPGGPGAEREMKHEVARKFAERVVQSLRL